MFFQNSPKLTILGNFNELLATQNLKVAILTTLAILAILAISAVVAISAILGQNDLELRKSKQKWG